MRRRQTCVNRLLVSRDSDRMGNAHLYFRLWPYRWQVFRCFGVSVGLFETRGNRVTVSRQTLGRSKIGD